MSEVDYITLILLITPDLSIVEISNGGRNIFILSNFAIWPARSFF